MTRHSRKEAEEVAGSRFATSAQPPRARPIPATRAVPSLSPRPIRRASSLETPGALRDGLRCLTASRPLPTLTVLQTRTDFHLAARGSS